MSWLSKLSNLGVGGVLTIFGSIIVLVGATLTTMQQGRSQRKLLSQSEQIASKSEQIANLNQELSNYVTGGDSYCWMFPMLDMVANRVTLLLEHSGKYPLRNVSVRITDKTKLGSLPFDKLVPPQPVSKEDWFKYLRSKDVLNEFESLRDQAETRRDFDILYPNTAIEFRLPQIPDTQKEQHWSIEIFSSNFYITEEILGRKIDKEGWKVSWRVVKRDLDGSEKTIKENINPQAPLKEK